MSDERPMTPRDALNILTRFAAEYAEGGGRMSLEWAEFEEASTVMDGVLAEHGRLTADLAASETARVGLVEVLTRVADATISDGLPCWCLNDGYWDGRHTETCLDARTALAEQGGGETTR